VLAGPAGRGRTFNVAPIGSLAQVSCHPPNRLGVLRLQIAESASDLGDQRVRPQEGWARADRTVVGMFNSSAVFCRVCGEWLPLDVTRISTDGGEPMLECPRCETMLRVPVFGESDWAEDVGPDARAPVTGLCSEPDAEPEPCDVPLDELVTPGLIERVERRDPDVPMAGWIACRVCGQDVPLDSEGMRLTLTHAHLTCTSCGSELYVRRSDAFRNVDKELGWSFASYADDSVNDEPERESAQTRRRGGISRLFGRTRG